MAPIHDVSPWEHKLLSIIQQPFPSLTCFTTTTEEPHGERPCGVWWHEQRLIAPILLLRPVGCVPHRLDHHGAAGAPTDGLERRGGRVAPAAQSSCGCVSKAKGQTEALTDTVLFTPLTFTGTTYVDFHVERFSFLLEQVLMSKL